MTDAELMAAIKTKYGEWIDEAVHGSPFPAALLAGLIANEGGLDEHAQRFEPKVYGDLTLVLLGYKPALGAIGGMDLENYLARVSMTRTNGPALSPQKAVIMAFQNLARSWGPTQIMGYQAVAGKYSLSELTNLQTHFRHAVEMLTDFGNRFHIVQEPAAGSIDFDGLFHCWNAGSPKAATFDPNYATKGLQRMQLYEG